MTHITVTPADEDEVIIAGAEREATSEPDARAASEPELVLEPELVPEPALELEREPVAESPSASASAPKPEPAAQKKARSDSYRETTLEDLESSQMPAMQRIIVIAAIVCIIGAFIYYFVAMR